MNKTLSVKHLTDEVLDKIAALKAEREGDTK